MSKNFQRSLPFFFCCSFSPFLLTLNKIRENMNDDFGSEWMKQAKSKTSQKHINTQTTLLAHKHCQQKFKHSLTPTQF